MQGGERNSLDNTTARNIVFSFDNKFFREDRRLASMSCGLSVQLSVV